MSVRWIFTLELCSFNKLCNGTSISASFFSLCWPQYVPYVSTYACTLSGTAVGFLSVNLATQVRFHKGHSNSNRANSVKCYCFLTWQPFSMLTSWSVSLLLLCSVQSILFIKSFLSLGIQPRICLMTVVSEATRLLGYLTILLSHLLRRLR